VIVRFVPDIVCPLAARRRLESDCRASAGPSRKTYRQHHVGGLVSSFLVMAGHNPLWLDFAFRSGRIWVGAFERLDFVRSRRLSNLKQTAECQPGAGRRMAEDDDQGGCNLEVPHVDARPVPASAGKRSVGLATPTTEQEKQALSRPCAHMAWMHAAVPERGTFSASTTGPATTDGGREGAQVDRLGPKSGTLATEIGKRTTLNNTCWC